MRKPVFVVAIMVLIFISLTVTPIRADELEDVIDKQRQLEQSEKQARSQLKKLEYTEDIKEKELKEISSQIVIAQTNLRRQEEAYKVAEEDVTASETELAVKQQELEGRRVALRNRIRGIYEEGSLSYLEVLFQATDLGDFITRVEYYNKLVENDQKLLTDIEDQKQVIEVKTQELRAKREIAARLQQEAAKTKAVLDEKKRVEQKSLAEVKQAQEELISEIERLANDSKSLENIIRQLQAARSGGVTGTISVWPLKGFRTISSQFGWRIHPITKKRSLHTGADIPAPSWTPIYAAGAGTVIYAAWYGAYGNAVIIDHGNKLSSMYPHQVKMAVKNGQEVKAGQLVGYVGSTGWSTGPHLHFEIRENGSPVNPLKFYN